jgi:hypothetical protein
LHVHLDDVCNLYNHLKYNCLADEYNITITDTTLIERWPGRYVPAYNYFIKVTADESKSSDATNILKKKLISILNQFS